MSVKSSTIFVFGSLAFLGCTYSGSAELPRRPLASPAKPAGLVAEAPQPARLKPPETHFGAAHAALQRRDAHEATTELRLALQSDPLNAESHFLLGSLLAQQGERDQAAVGFQRAAALDPANADALYNLGTMLLERGERLTAARLLENTVLARPDYVRAYNNLGKAYFMIGLPEYSVAAYEETLRRDPSNALALRNLLVLAEAAGLHDAAANYRTRLGLLRPRAEAGRPVALAANTTDGPTWPRIAFASGETPGAPGSPAAPARVSYVSSDKEVVALREILRDLPAIGVERRGGRLALTGWTTDPQQKQMLERVLQRNPQVLDLTTEDVGDSQRIIEIDATIFIVQGLENANLGFNFLQLINLDFNYFASDSKNEGTGFTAPPDVTGAVTGLSQSSWIFGAGVSYDVNIANAASERIAVLARPHLTALSGSSAEFLAGGELVYSVSGLNSGDIKPYPFGTELKITPRLLRTRATDGTPRVHMKVEAGRTSILAALQEQPQGADVPTPFTKVTVASEAVLTMGETLVLSGLSQRESRKGRSGVPVLRNIPVLKYLFSTETTLEADLAVIILLTPRDPGFFDERNRRDLAEFIERRRAFVQARRGTEEDMLRFRERYPDWSEVQPSRLASQLYMTQQSELYRSVSGERLESEALQLDLLGATE